MKSKQNETVSWSELAKKIVYTSLGSAHLASQAVKESKIPQEVIKVIKQKAEKRKEDIMDVMAKEVSKFLGKINVADEMAKALKGLVINLSASIDFQDSKKGLKPRAQIKKAAVRKGK